MLAVGSGVCLFRRKRRPLCVQHWHSVTELCLLKLQGWSRHCSGQIFMFEMNMNMTCLPSSCPSFIPTVITSHDTFLSSWYFFPFGIHYVAASTRWRLLPYDLIMIQNLCHLYLIFHYPTKGMYIEPFLHWCTVMCSEAWTCRDQEWIVYTCDVMAHRILIPDLRNC